MASSKMAGNSLSLSDELYAHKHRKTTEKEEEEDQ